MRINFLAFLQNFIRQKDFDLRKVLHPSKKKNMKHPGKFVLRLTLLALFQFNIQLINGQPTRPVKLWNQKGLQLNSDSLQFEEAAAYFDSGYYPRSMYLQVRIAGLNATALPLLQKGTTSCWLKNPQGDSIPCVKPPRHYAALRDRETGLNNLLLSLPLDPARTSYKNWTMYFIWFHPEAAIRVRGNFLFR